jgi:hypothetical protein
MKGTLWIRLALCGFVAGVIWNLLSVLFLATVAPEFVASIQRTAPHPAQGGAFFFAIDLLMGVWAVWLYSAIAPRYGAKPATAAIAGIAWWILKTLQSAKWAGLGFVELGPTVILLGLATLGATILASAAGIWLYSKVGAPSPPDLSAR